VGRIDRPTLAFLIVIFSSVERNFFTHTYLSFLFFLKSNQSYNTLAGVRNHIAKSIEVLNLDSKYMVVNPYFIKSNIPNKNSKPIKFLFLLEEILLT